MNVRVVRNDHVAYVVCDAQSAKLETEQDGLDVIGACLGEGIDRLMLHADSLSEAFFELRTGLAGNLLQKFVNYQIQTAMVIPTDRMLSDRVKEWFSELNKGREFGVFADVNEAERWLAAVGGTE